MSNGKKEFNQLVNGLKKLQSDDPVIREEGKKEVLATKPKKKSTMQEFTFTIGGE